MEGRAINWLRMLLLMQCITSGSIFLHAINSIAFNQNNIDDFVALGKQLNMILIVNTIIIIIIIIQSNIIDNFVVVNTIRCVA